MGSILVAVPDIADHQLVFNEAETRQILKFFWPQYVRQIDTLTITNDARRLAQTALIAAIDGSYAMGFIDATFRSLLSPGRSVAAFGRRLARNFVQHWWKYATREELMNAKVYESVRTTVAGALRHRLDALVAGVALRRPLLTPFHLHPSGSTEAVWS